MKLFEHILGRRSPSKIPDQFDLHIDEAYVGVYKGLMWSRMAIHLMTTSNSSSQELLEEAQRIVSVWKENGCKRIDKSKQDARHEFKSELISRLKLLKTP